MLICPVIIVFRTGVIDTAWDRFRTTVIDGGIVHSVTKHCLVIAAVTFILSFSFVTHKETIKTWTMIGILYRDTPTDFYKGQMEGADLKKS